MMGVVDSYDVRHDIGAYDNDGYDDARSDACDNGDQHDDYGGCAHDEHRDVGHDDWHGDHGYSFCHDAHHRGDAHVIVDDHFSQQYDALYLMPSQGQTPPS